MSGKNPLGNGREPQAYEGLNVIVPIGGWQLIKALRAPTTNDKKYPVGSIWVNTSSGISYQLVTAPGTWAILGGSSAAVATLTGDSGTATPSSGNIQIAGGTNITTSASGAIVTVDLDASISSLTSVTSTSFVTSSATLGTTYTTNTIAPTGSNANIDFSITPKGSGAILYSASKAGVNVNYQATNSDNTSGTSHASFQVATGGASSGDPYIDFLVSGAGHFAMGIDNSASDNFVLSASGTLGTSDVMSITSAGAMTTAAGITATTGNITATNGNLVLSTAGNKLSIATGANASVGTATLVGGTVTVSTTAVTASSIILLTRQSPGATGAAALGALSVGTITAATSFVINALQNADSTALQASDVSVVGWMIIN